MLRSRLCTPHQRGQLKGHGGESSRFPNWVYSGKQHHSEIQVGKRAGSAGFSSPVRERGLLQPLCAAPVPGDGIRPCSIPRG